MNFRTQTKGDSDFRRNRLEESLDKSKKVSIIKDIIDGDINDNPQQQYLNRQKTEK